MRKVYERVKQSGKRDFSALVTGLGKRFLASKAAEKVGFKNIADFDDLVPGNVSKASTAVGLAFMVASKLEGGVVKWKQ